MNFAEDLQYGYAEQEEPAPPARAPPRTSRNQERGARQDFEGGDGGTPRDIKAMPRASSELNMGRQARDADRKAKTPDPAAAAKTAADKKQQRGKSPFKFLNKLRDPSGDRRGKGKTPEPAESPRGVADERAVSKAKSPVGVRISSVSLSSVAGRFQKITELCSDSWVIR